MKQTAMKFGDIKLGFESSKLIGECWKIVTDGIKKEIIDQIPARNNHAEYVIAKYQSKGIQIKNADNVPRVCDGCPNLSNGCLFLEDSKIFSSRPCK